LPADATFIRIVPHTCSGGIVERVNLPFRYCPNYIKSKKLREKEEDFIFRIGKRKEARRRTCEKTYLEVKINIEVKIPYS
jgi:hypothetical protein